MTPQLSTLWRSLKIQQIFGANTNVGKTVMSTIICKALANNQPTEQTWYLKPVSTGREDQADHLHISKISPNTKTKCLYQFEEAVSPHIAARSSLSKPVSDSKLREETLIYIKSCAQAGPGTVLLETAGGVNSPAPSGTLQGDLYRPLRFSIYLVADNSLGGISSTISAFESLHIRGYTVDAILQFENSKYQNHIYLEDYFRSRGIKSLVIPFPPTRLPDIREDLESMSKYYSEMVELKDVKEFLKFLSQKHKSRIEELERMSADAHAKIWYPFTQHKFVSPESIVPIDSAYGDFFETSPLKSRIGPPLNRTDAVLSPSFDGSASWWTQGLGHASPALALAAAHAAGRYGHVMFAGNIHQPALKLAEILLDNLKNPRLSKVFFSDNGSTGVEVAIKMALSATSERYKCSGSMTKELGVIGLKGSYHGDTIGAMDCSEPSIFNKKVHWYQGRGYWFDFPKVSMEKGHWVVTLPPAIHQLKTQRSNKLGETTNKSSNLRFSSLGKIFNLNKRNQSDDADLYRLYIIETLKTLIKDKGFRFGAVIMEPVLLGAGGMQFIDPLFQHALVNVVRSTPDIFAHHSISNCKDKNSWTGLPIIFDEVFTGLYRLGRFSAATLLQIYPDISIHAKLLTGGLLPLSCTIASQNIYESFIASSKTDALLHGHSYTAHPVGCQVASTSLRMLMDLDTDETWKEEKVDWWRHEDWAGDLKILGKKGISKKDSIWNSGYQRSRNGGPDVWSVWSYDFISSLSYQTDKLSVVAIGSVLAIALKDENAGYASTASIDLQKRLLEGIQDFQIHVRVLGNVVYLMASQTSGSKTLRKIEELLMDYFHANSKVKNI